MTTERRILGLAVVFTVIACGDSGGGRGPTEPDPSPAPSAVTITTGTTPPPRFIPATTELAVGGSVTWQNGSPAPVQHDVISNTDAWASSPRLDAGDTFQVTFDEAGVFEYRCSIHPGMEGTVTVR